MLAYRSWDEPGAGRSDDLPEGDALGDFAGLSWGGTVVLELYRRHPGLVATLIMIDTYAGWKGR